MTVLCRLIVREGPLSRGDLLHEIKLHKYEIGTPPSGIDLLPDQAAQLLSELLDLDVRVRTPRPAVIHEGVWQPSRTSPSTTGS